MSDTANTPVATESDGVPATPPEGSGQQQLDTSSTAGSKADVGNTQPTPTGAFILQGSNVLTRVVSVGETKDAVIAMIQRMDPKAEMTGRWMSYLLRVFDNPTIIVEDIAYLDTLVKQAKERKSWWGKIKTGLLKILGLVLTSSGIGAIIIKLLGG